ncbi:hypothetical protein [Bradyrhizobium sp. DASA03120]|uniref:hypothetical protein n=1 Tax=Bradyrhizobium sp. SMVTL-02 TaxID=3395917 RepID=UPI003F701E8C
MLRWWINYQYWKQDTIRFEYRVVLIILLFLAAACLVVAGAYAGPEFRGKWVNSAGLMFDVGGVVQLHISGLFDRIVDEYGDEEKYPYGPPSHITRRIIDNPDEPVRMWIRGFLFFDANTGFYLLLAGFAFQLMGTWV